MNQYALNNPAGAAQQPYGRNGATVLDEIHSGATTYPAYGTLPNEAGWHNGQLAQTGQTAERMGTAAQTAPMGQAGAATQATGMAVQTTPAHQAAVSLAQPETLQFDHGLPMDAIVSPVSAQEAFVGSIKALLGKNLGHYVVASFLVGTQEPVSWQGFLHAVGNDYIVIFQPDMGRYVTCDMYSLKFVEFHDQKGVIPTCAGVRRRDGAKIW